MSVTEGFCGLPAAVTKTTVWCAGVQQIPQQEKGGMLGSLKAKAAAAAAAARIEWNSDPVRDALVADIENAIKTAGKTDLAEYMDMDECCEQAQLGIDAGVQRSKAIARAVEAAAVAAVPVKDAALVHKKALLQRDASNKGLLLQQAAAEDQAARKAAEEEARRAAEDAARTADELMAARARALLEHQEALRREREGYQTVPDEEAGPRPPPPPPPPPRARWFWEEEAHLLAKHSPESRKGNFIAYSGTVCAELDWKYNEWVLSGKSERLAKADVDLSGRISSTGTEHKVNNLGTGAVFTIDFANLKQINKT